MTIAAAQSPAAAVPFAEALRFWLKLGFISFGGPAGQIAIMHQEVVERRRWLSERRFLHALDFRMVLPGPEAQQLATYIGWLLHRTRGGIVAGVLFVLPSLAVFVALSWIYLRFGNVPAVVGVLYGIKPAVTAIVVFEAWRIDARALKHPFLWAIAVLAFVAIYLLHFPFPAIVAGAAAIGWLGARRWPHIFSAAGHGSGKASNGHALIDDGAPPPEHARWSVPRALRVAAFLVGLWATSIGALALIFGWQATLTQMGWFSTKAALLTFGGAYAVLPYVFEGAVRHHEWLTTAQMIDGLALGETTPGPLIMVVAFVGFVGGWSGDVLGPDAQFAGGVLAAALVSYFTFLPSFLFILVGAPFIESTHGQLRFTAPLTGITAAVVGVIVNLAVFFAVHVLWHSASGGRFDRFAALIAAGAFFSLWRWKAGVVTVIAASAAAGLVLNGWR